MYRTSPHIPFNQFGNLFDSNESPSPFVSEHLSHISNHLAGFASCLPSNEPQTLMSNISSGRDVTHQRIGNNIYGAAGTRKCAVCRTRKAKCEYDRSNPSQSCAYCVLKGLSCGKKMNAQDFSRQGRRKRRSLRDVNSYKNHTWSEVVKGRLSDLVTFVESQYSEKTLEEMLELIVEVVAQLRTREDVSVEEALISSVNIDIHGVRFLHPSVCSTQDTEGPDEEIEKIHLNSEDWYSFYE